MRNHTRVSLFVVALGIGLVAPTGEPTSALAAQGASMVVTVKDRASDSALGGATVFVMQGKKEVGRGVTGADGTVTLTGLPTGSSVVNSEKDLYIDKPEKLPKEIAAGANTARMTLLHSGQTGAYYRAAGQSIEKEAAALPENAREMFFKHEWQRIMLLPQELQIPVVTEFKSGRRFLASEPQYQALLKSGKIVGDQ